MLLDTTDLADLTVEELEAAYAAIGAEIDRRLNLESIAQQAEDLAARYEEAVAGNDPKAWVPGLVVGPGEKVIENGIEYVNVSKAWLSASPSQYILGYQRTSPPPQEVPNWVTGETITWAMIQAGPVLRKKGGVVYQAVQPHTTQEGWAPDLPGMTALWVVAVAP